MQVMFGILLTSIGVATGSLVHDPVVCRFKEDNQCDVALGQQLHLQLPLEENNFSLKFIDKASTHREILRYKENKGTPNPRWRFVKDNNTMILNSAERSDSGTYSLETFTTDGKNKGNYSLQINIEDHTLVILSTICGLLIIISVVAFYMYRKRQSLRNKEARSQETIPATFQAQAKNIEYAVVAHSSQSKQKKSQNELQYGELVFNNPTTSKSEKHKVKEDCVYSEVQFSQ